MAICDYQFPFESTSEELYSKMKALVEQKGGSIQGDSANGEITFKRFFMVVIKATYSIANQVISIEIQKNLLNIDCIKIESEIRNALFN